MENNPIKVLLVENDIKFARTMRESLTAQTTARIELLFSEDLSDATKCLEENRFDAIVLDLSLPDSQGLNTFARIHALAPLLPIIILADFDNETQALRAVRDGAQDYLVKARAEGKLLSRSIRYAIERKRVEEALRESEQRYRRLLGSTTDYIYTVTMENGRWFRSSHSPGCVAVTGYSPNEYDADPCLWFQMIYEEDRQAVTDQITRLLAGETVAPLEHRIVHKSGAVRWVRNTPVPRKDEQGKVISYDGLVSDITERKRAEGRLAAKDAVTVVLSEAGTLGEAAPRILHATGECLGWGVGALWRIDAQADLLRCVDVWHKPTVPIPEFEAITRQITFAKGVGLPGRIWASAKPAWIVNVVDDGSFPRAPSAVRESLHAAFGFPITLDQEVLGIIEFFSTQIQEPDEELLRMMSAIGSQIGQFIVRKQAEEALAEERNVLRTLIDTIPDAIYVKDTQSRFVLGNPGVAQLMGAPKVAELKGKTDFDFFPRHLALQYHADEQAILLSGQPLINRVEPVIDPMGKNGWLLTTKAPIRDSRGRIVGLVGIGRDITERKRVEEQHRLSEARLQAILDNTTAVIYLKDTQGRYLLVNRRFEALFHITREQVTSKTDYDLFPKEMADAFRANDLKVLAAAAPLEFEEIAPHDGSLQTYLSIKFPLSDSAGVPYAVCGISTDITERKRAEEQLRHAYAEGARSEEALRRALAELKLSHEDLKSAQLQLIQAEKLESIGTLAAGVAHEVKNPLQTILMGIDYLTNQGAIDNPCANMVLVEMRDAIARADSIVRELLEFSAANHPEVADEELSAIIEQSLGLMKFELIKNRISVVRELSPGLPLLKLDRNKIQQVFINLFINSIQAMPEGGTLTVRTYARQSTNARSVTTDPGLPHPRSGESFVVAEIEDTGVGIPPDKLTKVFDPFFTTKPPGVGSGLGLSVTKKIIELHGASMNIANRNKRGVRVSIQFKI